MMRSLAFPLSLVLAASLLAEDELPVDPEEPLEIEPPLLIQEVPNRDPGSAKPEVVQEPDPERIQVALESAQKSATSGERLYRIGALAKVEAENRALKVIRLESDLANAKLEVAKQTVAAQQSRFEAKEISVTELETAKSVLLVAENEAASAKSKREKAELDAALLNLTRQKKLLARGVGRKSDVTRAEEKVAALQQQEN
jgi:hypothetical protein